ncbi:MAG: hypothetical protein L0226_11770 [Acidobacteria bacterium]|nr:hypothetical protein [Acidobacteriota bacterium]
MRSSFFVFAIMTALLLPIEPVAQKKSAQSAGSRPAIEPLREVSGVMKDNRIKVEQSDWINKGKPLFEYTLMSARIVDGRLEFTGSLREAGKNEAAVTRAMLIATTARSANPWPGAGSSTARERRPTSQGQQRERGEATEQTQSLYSAAEAGSGCELLYLKMQAPRRSSPLQVGVVLAPRDNELGNQINQAVCRVVRAMNARENTNEALARLNRLIGRE